MSSTLATLDDAVRAFLERPWHAVLGTLNPDGSPHLTVIWYALRGNELVINTTTERRKHRNLSRDPRVSVLAGDHAVYVRADGRAREIASGAEALGDIRRLGVRYDGEAEAERQTRERWSKQPRVTYAIRIERLYRYGF